jgi:hypothetical protein
MTAVLLQPPRKDATRIAFHDRVRVPDGRIGEIKGFYRRSVESALVSFPRGGAEEFLISEVEPI